MKRLNFYYVILVAILIITLKLWYRGVPDNQPEFMLAPLTLMVEIVSGENALISSEGYYFADLNIIINKSCSGLNFLCICFALISIVIAGYPSQRRYLHYLTIVPVLLCSYIITLLVNTSRILLAILINKQIHNFGLPVPEWLHVAEGMFVYLFFLILIYMLTNALFTKKTSSHEKPV
ncbi:exosortase K [Bacteroides sp. 519]|uniref:exosortase K n=1 Tax=Bacteroides sp. 519 TaxID=2302937 RepID=UPI0013D6459F|nr:exosortase K [Bacteroides sp. 519]NDV57123.1 exosortase K [Bacteroides sp. 519]